MRRLVKPSKLNSGDTVAAVSLSWGGAGDDEIRWRYEQGKERLQRLFDLKVIEMPHTLAGTEYIYRHPEARAEDLSAAFSDSSVKGVFSCIGGEDTLRLLPFVDFGVIRKNPKVFIGYSDTTVNHFICYKAGLSSFYGPAILSDFAENIAVPEYTVDCVKKALFSAEPIGEIKAAPVWTSEYLRWSIENKDTARNFSENTGYISLQGRGKTTGHLIGGCVEVMDWLRGTPLFPAYEDFSGAILFLETSEDTPSPGALRYLLRSLGVTGVLGAVNGIVIGKPYGEKYFEEYQVEYKKVLAEFGRDDMPVLYNLSFGHCEPKCCIPYGAMAEIDCDKLTFSILESGVV